VKLVYEYGAPLGGLSGRRSPIIIESKVKRFLDYSIIAPATRAVHLAAPAKILI